MRKLVTPLLVCLLTLALVALIAGCGGGDIISFWMKLKSVDYKTAVKELKEWTS